MSVEIGRLVEYIIAAVIVIGIIPAAISMGVSSGGTAVVNPTVDDAVQISSSNGIPDTVTVRASKGNALRFANETDSVASSAPVTLTNGSWTVCAAASLSSTANRNVTYTVFAYDNASVLLQYDAGAWSAYYENDSGADAIVRIPADDPAAGLVPVCGRYNESRGLSLSRGDTITAPQELSNETASRNVSETWQGRIDEVRAFGEAVDNETIVKYADDPIQPLPGRDRLARWMFDEGSGSTTTVFFAGTEATITGATWTTGVNPPGLTKGVDYELEGGPFRLRVPSGSYLDGAPAAYVSWSSNSIVDLIVGFVPVFALLLLVFAFRDDIERLL